MLKIAITGNIASGKTKVENILRAKSYNVLDTDKVAHDLYKDLEIKAQIISTFSEYNILENNEISRTKLSKIVFRNPDLMKRLENILHPLIKNKIIEFFDEMKDEKITFVAVPLLFEAKMENLFDKIILIYANDKIRSKRLISRNNFSLEQAKKRLDSQMNQDEKLSLTDYTIYNNKAPDDLRKNVEKILELL